MRPGLIWSPERSRARVWAPSRSSVDLCIDRDDRRHPLEPSGDGWFVATLDDVRPGDRYDLALDGDVHRPDPGSLSQPEGVHGPSEVVDLGFDWTDRDWENRPLHDHVIYELHVGTFSDAGTFDGVARRLPHLVELGVTAIELMPVAQFPGTRNWGYDGVGLYATQSSYGGPGGLMRLVDACHSAGIAVYLDVVYNHLGPEGNYLRDFGPYFTDRYRTPWGEAVNLDGRGSDAVRTFFIENALMWVDDFHIDGLRLDAVHAIFDQSARPFVGELSDAVHERASSVGRVAHVIAESSSNDPRLVRDGVDGGLGLDAAWNDDFHHALHVALTGETARYYADFDDPISDLTTGLSDGYIAAGRYSPYRGRRHGASSADLTRSSLVVFSQNHDQVGNRAGGDRLSTLVDPERLRFAAAITLLSPWVPMLFMGEEWAETRPFLYFIDHGDADLSRAVTAGRAREFEGFINPGEHVPDPADPATFLASILDWSTRDEPAHAAMLDLYSDLIRIRSTSPAIGAPDPSAHRVTRLGTVLRIESEAGNDRIVTVANAGATWSVGSLPDGRWTGLLDTADARFGGPGRQTPTEVAGESIELGPWVCATYRGMP